MSRDSVLTAKDVSLVIPSNHAREELGDLLGAVYASTLVPGEIIIVQSRPGMAIPEDTLPEKVFQNKSVSRLLVSQRVNVHLIDIKHAFPGSARNIGVSCASGKLIAFLDVKTIPEADWLEKILQALNERNLDGVWGSRLYDCNAPFGAVVRDAIYGRRPVRSLSGSIFRRELYSTVGEMISWAPAGEDVDWMRRVKTHRLSFLTLARANHRYQNLNDKSLIYFLKKWWRYYHHSRLLPVNDRDRWLSLGLLYVVLLFFAFNWNYKISGAIFGSPIVVPHITTVLAITGPLIYIFLRAVYLPLKRGTPLRCIFPFRFLSLLFVASILDIVKIVALIWPFGRKLHEEH